MLKKSALLVLVCSCLGVACGESDRDASSGGRTKNSALDITETSLEVPTTVESTTPSPVSTTLDVSGRTIRCEDRRGQDLRGANFEGTLIDGADFSGANLEGASFLRASHPARLQWSECDALYRRDNPYQRTNMPSFREMPNFSGANLRGAKFGEDIQSGQVFVRGLIDVQEMRIEVAGIFDGADLTGASFDNAILDASWAYTRFARIGGLSFSRANLSGANLRNVWGVEVDFVNANLSNADLSGAIFQTRSANYPRCAPIGGAVATAPANLHVCRNGRLALPQDTVICSNEPDGCDGNVAFFSGANLSGANLTDAVLAGAMHRTARNVYRSGERYRGAVLTGANLRGANLTRADLRGAILRGADLTGAIVTDARFEGADLESAILPEGWVGPTTTTTAPLVEGSPCDDNFDVTRNDEIFNGQCVGDTSEYVDLRPHGALQTVRRCQVVDSSVQLAAFFNVRTRQCLIKYKPIGAPCTTPWITEANLTGRVVPRLQPLTPGELVCDEEPGLDRGGRGERFSYGGPHYRAWAMSTTTTTLTSASTTDLPRPAPTTTVVPATTLPATTSTVNYASSAIDGADFSGRVMIDGDFTGAQLRNASFVGANLYVARLPQAVLTGANFTDAILRRADFTNGRAPATRLDRANLTRADVRRANLNGVRLDGSTLVNADFSGANLELASLRDANVNGANFSEANLTGADLRGVSNVVSARFGGAYMSGARLPDGFDCVASGAVNCPVPPTTTTIAATNTQSPRSSTTTAKPTTTTTARPATTVKPPTTTAPRPTTTVSRPATTTPRPMTTAPRPTTTAKATATTVKK